MVTRLEHEAASCYRFGDRYTGCVVDWHGNQGYLSCTLVPEAVFLHASDLEPNEDPARIDVGISVNFELAENPHEECKFRAVEARTFV